MPGDKLRGYLGADEGNSRCRALNDCRRQLVAGVRSVSVGRTVCLGAAVKTVAVGLQGRSRWRG